MQHKNLCQHLHNKTKTNRLQTTNLQENNKKNNKSRETTNEKSYICVKKKKIGKTSKEFKLTRCNTK